MSNAISLDLRRRVVEAHQRLEGGYLVIALRFDVSICSVRRWVARWKHEATLAPRVARTGPPPLIPDTELPELEAFVAENLDLTTDALAIKWSSVKGYSVSRSAMARALVRAELPSKKTFVASEQDRPDVAEKREAFRQAILHLDAGRLVFIDETGSNLAMSPLYARARKGKRAYFKRPAARGSNISVIGALRLDGMLCFNAMDGALTGERFLLFLEHKLGPFLRAGDVVFLDNLRAHHVDGVRQLIESRGATLMYLPPYSPQMNPIEEAWSMFKAALRRASARTICDLVDALKAAMKAIGPLVATGFFKC